MKVVFCVSEAFPFTKTGGLADASSGLAQSLAKSGCQVKVFLPLYRNINPQKIYESFGTSRLGEVEFFFIKNDNYYDRQGIYGTAKGDYPDNLERFSFFNRQVWEVLKKIKFYPQIMHCHDWQSCGVIIYLKTLYAEDSCFSGTKCLLTIHNLTYQGIFDKLKFTKLGIPERYFTPQYLEFYGKINLLKGGIVFCDLATTVSLTYARQIQTRSYGCGLEGVLQQKSSSTIGIINAIDYKVWNPSSDNYIYKRYSPRNLSLKSINKAALQDELGLKLDHHVLLLGMVSRLVEQKGLDLVCQALDEMLAKYQLVILGLGEERYQEKLSEKSKKFKERFSLNLTFSEELAHKIYAACDAFLLPSRFEPCGISQMISYKYATPPVASHTGGLADTVMDVSLGGGGFVFSKYTMADFLGALERADEAFRNKNNWQEILKRIVAYDFSWDRPTKEYLKVYQELLVKC